MSHDDATCLGSSCGKKKDTKQKKYGICFFFTKSILPHRPNYTEDTSPTNRLLPVASSTSVTL